MLTLAAGLPAKPAPARIARRGRGRGWAFDGWGAQNGIRDVSHYYSLLYSVLRANSKVEHTRVLSIFKDSAVHGAWDAIDMQYSVLPVSQQQRACI
ncbi:hypothetical protein [Fluviibacterium sp. S390]|uniref:hypothetical protein n=1 Tax=Fluviibacterium sp. S390 TaxID=3415139 RepID=UPI003C7BE15A